jgi:hypothetical protein
MSEPSPHLDLDALADVLAAQEDPVGGPEAAHSGHLAGCPSCASRLAELRAAEARVVATLAALPPPPVPEDLAERLTSALSAETAGRGGGRGTGTVTALPARPARARRTWLPAAAAGVLLLSGAGLGLALLGDGGAEDGADSAADTTAAASATAGLLLTSSGTDWADAQAVTEALPRVLAGSTDRVALLGDDDATDGEGGDAAGGGSGELAATQEDARQSRAAEAAPAPDAQAAQAPGAVADPLARLRTPTGLASCLAALLPPDQPDVQPLALDYAQYEGQPALAVLLPDPDPAQLSVFVVAPGCSQEDDGTLYFVRVPRP